MADNRIYFVDVTNRDGVQTSRLGLAKLQKTLINLLHYSSIVPGVFCMFW